MPELSLWWSSSGWGRLAFDALWQSTLLAGVALAVIRLGRLRPAARAAVALAAAVLCVIAPLATGLARYEGWGLLTASSIEESPPRVMWDRAVTTVELPAGELSYEMEIPLDESAGNQLVILAQDWAGTVFATGWLLVSAVLAARLGRSAWAVRRTSRTAMPCQDSHLHAELLRAAATFGLQPPELRTSTLVHSPALVAWGTPRLLLPACGLPTCDWFAVFCHELAHLARRDGLGRLAVEITVVALPWQPLVWLLRREFRTACEEACDDWAVGAGADPVELAALLTDFLPRAGSVLVLGMSESVSTARSRILRLLAMQGSPRPRLGPLAGVFGWIVAIGLAVTLAMLQYGKSPHDLPPWGDKPAGVAAAGAKAPTERTAVQPYRIGVPDVLLIDAVKVVPKPPYRIESLDTVQVHVMGTLPDQEIGGPYPVEADGTIALGPAYGVIKLSGLTLPEAQHAITEQLENILTAPEVSISLAESAGQQQITGEHLVGPDGTVNLGSYGTVPVAGMTVAEARAAVERHLTQFLDKPQVSVDIFAYNSKFYYVICQREGADNVKRVPCTGRERVLDALTEVPDLKLSPTAWVWVSRATAEDGSAEAQILPVDWRAIFRGESNATNYWIEPGDRIFVVEK